MAMIGLGSAETYLRVFFNWIITTQLTTTIIHELCLFELFSAGDLFSNWQLSMCRTNNMFMANIINAALAITSYFKKNQNSKNRQAHVQKSRNRTETTEPPISHNLVANLHVEHVDRPTINSRKAYACLFCEKSKMPNFWARKCHKSSLMLSLIAI